MAHKPWPASAPELAEMRRFNQKLTWLPRFKIRNRVTPRLIQALLRVSQALKRAPLAETQWVGAVPVRILRPSGKPKGVVLDIHGGGWVIGNAQMDDDLNLGLVNACEVAVDYRLAVDTPIEGLMELRMSAQESDSGRGLGSCLMGPHFKRYPSWTFVLRAWPLNLFAACSACPMRHSPHVASGAIASTGNRAFLTASR
ncbi:hypothetical protein FX985_05723 [Pseudomonas extremaustralis]|uniref:Alpha/beta hydrolase fold-3 domain-containing protein n=1 Tax=Pseudomonas extremaustralis TaxID=359110 RepID=A0A5M9IRG6_9PSED|nr:hypothetical protein FX985_05723 [Pseudomonas extremaustralis]